MKTIVTTLLYIALAFSVQAQTVFDRYGRAGAFSDVVLVYAGNDGRNSWTVDQLTPYVTHRYADGSEKWFFDAFLFLEFAGSRDIDGLKTTFGLGNGMGNAKSANQADWNWLLDQYFVKNDTNPTKLQALDILIGKKAESLGKPAFRHKVIIVCPAPKKEGNKWPASYWGTVQGKDITLESEENRLCAVKWYIDTLIDRWNEAEYDNIDLEGIYWIEESMISNAGIIADVNDYARSKGLRTYWIPYYRSGNEPFCRKWDSDFKFDMCYFQPNYAFCQSDGSTMPKSQLDNTCQAAKKYGAGLELEFETSGKSNALHSVDPAAHRRINDYIDTYIAEGVFDNAGVAYYVGSRGLNDMDASADSVDHATIDRLASIVATRRAARGATVSNDGSRIVYTQDTPQGLMSYTFKNCMANDLFTFYKVTLDGKIVNSAEHSDNIGPFLLQKYGWTGGNHLRDDGSKSAKTVKVEALVDGKPLDIGNVRGNMLEITVTNELYLPDGSIFAIETMRYVVAGNSIEVFATHEYKIDKPIMVDRYYGMQSMFESEHELLVPGAKNRDSWFSVTPAGAENAIKIKKNDASNISVFFEKSPFACQATYMCREGLGFRDKIASGDFAFIGNSYGKCYHKLIGNTKIKPGDKTEWHGVYSWFREPIVDTFDNGPATGVIEYPAHMSGCPVTIKVDASGKTTITENTKLQ